MESPLKLNITKMVKSKAMRVSGLIFGIKADSFDYNLKVSPQSGDLNEHTTVGFFADAINLPPNIFRLLLR